MFSRARGYLRRRAAALVVVAAAGLACGAGGAPGSDPGDFAAALGEASGGGFVEREDVHWEPSDGVIADATVGRFVLFLSAREKGAPRDVWRARVRVSPEGHPIAIADAHDLTSTPLGDDHDLVVRGTRAAFATRAFGQEQTVTVLDLAGEGAQNTTTALGDRMMAWITNLQATGSGGGVGRIDVTLDEPARSVRLALEDRTLAIDLADAAGPGRHARVDLTRGELASGASGLHADGARHLPKRFVFWAVDTARAVSWIGPAPIAWLEDKAFALRDGVRQAAFKLGTGSDAQTLAAPEAAPPPSILDASGTGAENADWPPPSIRSIWKTAEIGEGSWEVPRLPWMRRVPGVDGKAPSPFFRTFIRPDEERPYARVLLVAMDMRQLELGMEAGVEDPKPLTGAHGNGRIPRDPLISTRVVAAFNGAFKTEHGQYGMMVNRRVLLPPQPGAATVVVLKDGRVGMGTWGASHDVTGLRGIPEQDVLSFRQNLDPLLDDGNVNPTKRAMWGYTLPGNGTQTERSGVCVTSAGHFIYAWGEDVSATTLGKAMKMAGCLYGMHLDMNPHHTGFLFATIRDVKNHDFKSEVLTSKMEISPDRYIDYAAKDFFYMMVHDPTPPALAGAEPWRPDGGAQPAPTWMPGVWTTRTGAGVELLDLEAGRALFRIRAGAQEPDAKTGATPARELSPDDAHKVLFALGLGVSHDKHVRGLATDGRMLLPLSGKAGVLVASPEGQLSIARGSDVSAIAPHADAAELPLLVDEGSVVPSPDPHGVAGGRAALGITASGRVLVARGNGSPSELGQALVRAGCARAVLLDRGTPGGAIHRTGTADPPRASYDETTLSAIAVPLNPRGFRFEAETAIARATR
jgi:hypothetical protein